MHLRLFIVRLECIFNPCSGRSERWDWSKLPGCSCTLAPLFHSYLIGPRHLKWQSVNVWVHKSLRFASGWSRKDRKPVVNQNKNLWVSLSCRSSVRPPSLSCHLLPSIPLPLFVFLVSLLLWWLKAALSALSVTISGCVWRVYCRCVSARAQHRCISPLPRITAGWQHTLIQSHTQCMKSSFDNLC